MIGRCGLGLLFAVALWGPDSFAAERTVPISERFSNSDAQPSYQKHVLPLMSKVGCSGRACHGSFQGQGGFRLSLFGYDFQQDHEALTGGDVPRTNLKSPEQSLILRKPTMQEDHGGEKIFDKDSWQYNIIARWIKAGAIDDSAANSEISHLEIQPKELVFKKAGEMVQLRVLAHWHDGTVEDVTDITRFRTNDDAAGGRDHYPRSMFCLLAGGGMRGGQVIGASDETAAGPKSDAITPDDVAASFYKSLGIDTTKEYHTPSGRPVMVVRHGKPLAQLWS